MISLVPLINEKAVAIGNSPIYWYPLSFIL